MANRLSPSTAPPNAVSITLLLGTHGVSSVPAVASHSHVAAALHVAASALGMQSIITGIIAAITVSINDAHRGGWPGTSAVMMSAMKTAVLTSHFVAPDIVGAAQPLTAVHLLMSSTMSHRTYDLVMFLKGPAGMVSSIMLTSTAWGRVHSFFVASYAHIASASHIVWLPDLKAQIKAFSMMGPNMGLFCTAAREAAAEAPQKFPSHVQLGFFLHEALMSLPLDMLLLLLQPLLVLVPLVVLPLVALPLTVMLLQPLVLPPGLGLGPGE
mmetsp:Transcript_6767/g.17332  ORF Transcript_6767/g.17332 Transcript_6767/m.17332 type:complete len:269 (+) Transcript_6767:650-1456(+)